jgi:hypothetical protein
MRVKLPPSALPGISPSRGEIGKTHPPCITLNVEIGTNGRRPSISPLEGEMPGRAEGGKPRNTQLLVTEAAHASL